MTTGPGSYRDQSVGALLDRLACKAIVDDVMENDSAVCVDCVVDVGASAEGRDDDRNLELGDGRQILFQAVVGPVDDEVDGKWRRRILRCSRSCSSRATVISLSQSRSADCGRAFSAGKDPMIPEVHCAMTRSGVEMMNIGEARTGTRSCDVRSAKVVTWNRLSDRRIREVSSGGRS